MAATAMFAAFDGLPGCFGAAGGLLFVGTGGRAFGGSASVGTTGGGGGGVRGGGGGVDAGRSASPLNGGGGGGVFGGANDCHATPPGPEPDDSGGPARSPSIGGTGVGGSDDTACPDGASGVARDFTMSEADNIIVGVSGSSSSGTAAARDADARRWLEVSRSRCTRWRSARRSAIV